MKNRCAYLSKDHMFTIRDCDIPICDDDHVIVKIEANGICGSDIHFYQDGRLGNYVVEKPYVPGHECSGSIFTMGKDVTGFTTGEKVVIEPGIPCGRCQTCLSGRYNLCRDVKFLSVPGINGTLCDYVAVRSDFVHKIPEDMSFELAALVEPTAVAVHAINLAGNVNGKTGIIMGAGPIGLLTMQCFKAAGGGKVICVDIKENRLKRALELSADSVINPKDLKEPLSDLGEVVIETAGSSITTAQLFSIAKVGGRVIQVGYPSDERVNMKIADLIDKELCYYGVQRYANAFPTAIAWLADGRINGKALITHRFSFDQVAEAFEFASRNPDKVIKTMVLNYMQ